MITDFVVSILKGLQEWFGGWGFTADSSIQINVDAFFQMLYELMNRA